jgi:hypothetical protein
MHDRDNFSDEVPVADAIAQEQDPAPVPTPPEESGPPIEADACDWQEQLQEVVDDDREEYRE